MLTYKEPKAVLHLVAPYHHHEVNNLPLMCGRRERDFLPPEDMIGWEVELTDVIVADGGGDITVIDVVDQMCPDCLRAIIKQREEVRAHGRQTQPRNAKGQEAQGEPEPKPQGP